jgi:hypothetical protein
MNLQKFSSVSPFIILFPFFLIQPDLSVASGEPMVMQAQQGRGSGMALQAGSESRLHLDVDGYTLTEEECPNQQGQFFEERESPMKRVLDTIGGDDVLVAIEAAIFEISMDIASNGDIYLAVQQSIGPFSDSELRVLRSQDGGTTWSPWGLLTDPSNGYLYPKIHVAEGVVDKCFLTYAKQGPGYDKIYVAASDLSLATGDFSTEIVVLNEWAVDFLYPHITSDSGSYNEYYIYLVGTGFEGGHSDIWFARSIDQGETFEAPYRIADLSADDQYFILPRVAYGYSGFVHVVWGYEINDDISDEAVMYRRASNRANEGTIAWGGILTLATPDDGIDDRWPVIGASRFDGQVVISYDRIADGQGYSSIIQGSEDAGGSFPHVVDLEYGSLSVPYDVEKQAATGRWIVAGDKANLAHLVRSDETDMTIWSEPEGFHDYNPSGSFMARSTMALDPSRGDQVAMAWKDLTLGAEVPDTLKFDAEWRGGPGFPNLEPGFPLGLTASPISPPAVADIDGDDDLEIVFSDDVDRVQVLHHDGTPLAGWPVEVGIPLAEGPVAIGDLNGSGEPTLVVGTADGTVAAYNAAGQTLSGWPARVAPYGQDVYVSIGALGPPYHRYVAACADHFLTCLNYQGNQPLNFPSWNFNASYDFLAPVAIGDIDNDGISEMVGGIGPFLFAVELYTPVPEFSFPIGGLVSDAVTLADVDGDGDVEIFLPTQAGYLHAYDGDGSVLPGSWPFDTGSGHELTSVAIAQMFGGDEPELAFATQNWQVHLLLSNGTEHINFPRYTTEGYWIYGAPVIGRVNGTVADVVIGARDENCWAWDTLGLQIPGWPKAAGDKINLSPAVADLDLDGAVEVVVLTDSQLLVMDLNISPLAEDRTWGMYGHDPQRTGCSDCPEDVTTAVQAADGITRVSFAAPSPNPVGASSVFSYAIPSDAVVSLDIFDLRGQRVCTVIRQESGPGQHKISWSGENERGERLASGQYLARLQVRGPKIREELTRKITILR